MKQLKKIFVQLLIIALLLFAHSVCNAYAQSYVSYNAETQKINISGTGKKLSELPVIVVPYGINEENLSELTDDQILLHMLYTDKDGKFNDSIGGRDTWGNGFYKSVITNGDDKFISWFIYADNASTVLSAISGKDISGIKSTLMSTDLVDTWSVQYIDEASSYLYYNNPSSADEFLKNYVLGLALESVKKGDDTLKNIIYRFSGYTDINIDEYMGYSDEIKQEVENLIKSSSDKESFKNIYDKYLLIARINHGQTDSELQKLIIDNKVKIGIDLSKYNSLNSEYSKLQVFTRIVGKKYSSLADIKAAFDNSCIEVENLLNSGANVSVSGGGGGNSPLSGLGTVGNAVIDIPNNGTNKGFSDMENHWSKSVVEKLVALGIISGYPDGTFAPDGIITRAEFVKMICAAMGVDKVSYYGEFSDVANSDWFSGYISGLYSKGIIFGNDGTFEPNRPITRQDATVIIWRAVCYGGYKSNGAQGIDFYDTSNVSEYAKESVRELSGLGVINGYEGYFNPMNNLTRGEAAQVVKGLLDVPEIKTGR